MNRSLDFRIRPALVPMVLLAAVLAAHAASGDGLPNADFTAGDQSPEGWRLQGDQGRWVDREILEVTGRGNDSSYWRCDDCPLEPGALYHFEMRARRLGGSGTAIAGPSFANRDYRDLSADWKWFGHVFRVPEEAKERFLRLGHWNAQGTIQFDAVRLTPCLPVHASIDGLRLGEGETIRDGQYQFQATFGGPGSNFHRPLWSTTTAFNSDRWCFFDDSQVTYRFALPGHRFLSGEVSFEVNYHTRGACQAEVSRDQKTWRPLCTQEGLGTGQAALPSDLLPAPVLFLRLRTASPESYFQVNRIVFQAELDGTPPEATGQTCFATLAETNPALAVEELAFDDGPAGTSAIRLEVRNTATKPIRAALAVEAEAGPAPASSAPQRADLAPGAVRRFRVAAPGEPGTHQLTLKLQPSEGPPLVLGMTVFVPDFYRTDYGQLIAGASSRTAVWWCDAMHKIPRQRPAPATSSPAARLAAARHDYEAVQIVVRPTEPLQGLTAKSSALTGPDGATIGAEHVRILQVYYHFVDHPTDRTGVRDFWPDALPPLDRPIDVAAGENQPLWVLVYVPADARGGDYTGTIDLEAEGWSATVPIRLHVWNFTLPERNHLETAFGLSAGSVFHYHQLKTEEDKRKVLDLYFQSFAEHRISPYDPTPLDPIRVKFLPEAEPPRAELDFAAFDRAMARAVERFHFTNFRLPLQGMGGGTFHQRWEPKIGDYGESTPQYQAMFSSYVQQLERQLRDRGWLEMAYTYWFDEPDPKDYEFVRKGMERIKRYAPGLTTMLTEEPVEALAGPIDIWCPVSFNYDHEAAQRRRAHGERFWWYVCCGPKAPYCTLFIDHPASELRVWLWQTWQRDIRGILVWQSNYWTSSAAYPDEPQNPYEDPMGYVSGYSTPRGVKRYWGNGDGRFIYPPLAAAVPGASGPEPVLQGPASSIRWEMLREGIEDYEYLYLLRDLLAKHRDALSPERIEAIEALLEVPEAITADMTTFTTDPAPIYARRAAIAEAIEQLVK